ncbi:MAG: TIGR00730 family Rossman fold protein [Actinomycetia bacterium]|nr:TIGR00730 family Rossman fold protein [Actinomycetes bacterium]
MAQPPSGRKRSPQGEPPARALPSAEEDRRHSSLDPETPQTRSPAYRLGFADPDFLLRDELRPSRLQLEYLKPEILQRDRGITNTVVMFGSARIPAPENAAAFLAEAEQAAARNPGDQPALERARAARALVEKGRFYDEARRLAQMISGSLDPPAGSGSCRSPHGPYRVVVVTGGGPGIMEAANRGAYDVGAESVGLNIVLPFEQRPNAYITPHLCFNFHYFALRKLHFMMRAVALVVFPGGFGTLDELFEVLTLIQTRKIKPIPVLLFGQDYWERIINFPALVEEGVINRSDLEIFSYVETAESAWAILEPALKAYARRR